MNWKRAAIKNGILFIILFVFVLPVFGQTEEQKKHPKFPDLQKSIQAFSDSYSKGNYEIALKIAKETLELSKDIYGEEDLKTASIHNYIGIIHFYLGNYKEAVTHYQISLDIYLTNPKTSRVDIAASYNQFGAFFYSIGEYEKAAEYYNVALKKLENAKTKEESIMVAVIYNHIGLIYRAKGENIKAIEYYTLAKDLAVNINGEYDSLTATCYNNIGSALLNKGDIKNAILNIEKAHKIRLEIFKENPNHRTIGISYNNIAEAHRLNKNYDQALENYEEALKIFKLFGETHSLTTICYNNIADTYRAKGNYKKAIEEHKNNLSRRLNTIGINPLFIAFSYNNLAKALFDNGEHDAAIDNYKNALLIFEKFSDRYSHIELLRNLSIAYKAQSNIPAQIETLNQAVDLILKYRQSMGKDKEYFTQKFIPIFEELIQIYNEQGDYEKAFEISEKMRGLSMMEEINLKYALKSISPPKDSKEYNVFQDNSNKFLNLRGQMQGLDSQRVAALSRGEAGKAQLETISKKIMETQNQMDVIEKDFSKNPEYTKLRKFIPPSIKEIQKKLKDRNQVFLEYDLIQKDGKEELHVFVISPDGLKQAKWDVTGLSDKVKQLRSIISLEPSSRSFVRLKDSEKKEKWCNSKACLKLEENEEYKESILDLQNSFKNDAKLRYIQKVYQRDGSVKEEEATRKMEQLLKEVYSLTFNPILTKGLIKPNSKLVISPDNVLFNIPFSALKNEKGKYAIEEFEISLIHSASIWERLIKNGELNHTKPLFAMGNAVYDGFHNDSFRPRTEESIAQYEKTKNVTRKTYNAKELDESDHSDLNESLAEIQAVSTLVYKKKEDPEHIYLGIRANKDELYKKFENPKDIYRSVLFSVHGILNMESPELNSLLLTSRQRALKHKSEKNVFQNYEAANGKLTRDGTFKLGETIELGIKTDLLVMSACETSLGTEKAGEGMVGLPQGFLMGGANNVLATLWSISSTGTMFFMNEFFESYFQKEKTIPANSLQMIQKKFATKKDKYGDPFYWSPFVVYGK